MRKSCLPLFSCLVQTSPTPGIPSGSGSEFLALVHRRRAQTPVWTTTTAGLIFGALQGVDVQVGIVATTAAAATGGMYADVFEHGVVQVVSSCQITLASIDVKLQS